MRTLATLSPAAQRQPTAVGSTLDLEQRVRELKRERNAVLLAHFYQESEIQDLADFIGDSLQLAREAQRTSAEVILYAARSHDLPATWPDGLTRSPVASPQWHYWATKEAN